MKFTQDQLIQIIVGNTNADKWYTALTSATPEKKSIIDRYELNTVNRLAGFLAQCAHESARFTVIRENLNYRVEGLRKTFPKYFPTDAKAQEYAHKQEKIANRVYASRMGNGDEASGDGWRYSGRGLIQLTGKDNYTKFAASINIPMDKIIAYLETVGGAADSAGWYWSVNNLNKTADANDIIAMTKKINGGIVGIDDRTALYENAKKILLT